MKGHVAVKQSVVVDGLAVLAALGTREVFPHVIPFVVSAGIDLTRARVTVKGDDGNKGIAIPMPKGAGKNYSLSCCYCHDVSSVSETVALLLSMMPEGVKCYRLLRRDR